MGVYNAELFTNLGLCCFYAQQYDMALHCFQRALALASDENTADVWYNIGHVALVRSAAGYYGTMPSNQTLHIYDLYRMCYM